MVSPRPTPTVPSKLMVPNKLTVPSQLMVALNSSLTASSKLTTVELTDFVEVYLISFSFRNIFVSTHSHLIPSN